MESTIGLVFDGLLKALQEVLERLLGALLGLSWEARCSKSIRENKTKYSFSKRIFSLSELSWTSFGSRLGSSWEIFGLKQGV